MLSLKSELLDLTNYEDVTQILGHRASFGEEQISLTVRMSPNEDSELMLAELKS